MFLLMAVAYLTITHLMCSKNKVVEGEILSIPAPVVTEEMRRKKAKAEAETGIDLDVVVQPADDEYDEEVEQFSQAPQMRPMQQFGQAAQTRPVQAFSQAQSTQIMAASDVEDVFEL